MRFAIIRDTPTETQANGIHMLGTTSVRGVEWVIAKNPVPNIIADEETVTISHHHHPRT